MTNLSHRKSFLPGTKFLIILAITGVIALGVVAWSTRAGTQLGVTLNFPNAKSGDLNFGLVGHWTFDGKDMPSGLVNDVSGQGNHGSQRGMATSTAYGEGRVGQALNFDGSNDYIDMGTGYQNDFTSFSVSMWAKVDDLSATRQLFFNLNGQNLYPRGQILTTGVVQMQLRTGGVTQANGTSVGTITPRVWNHIVFTFNGVGGVNTTDIYINGVSSAPDVFGAGTLDGGTTDQLFIGYDNDTLGIFKGAMDDVRIYNRSLSPDEIKQLYQLGATTKVAATPSQPNSGIGLNSGLVGHWTLDGKDMPNGQVNDVSGQGNHGSLRNMSTTTSYKRGVIGQALEFDGSNDHIFVSDSNSLDVTSGLTASFWIRPQAFTLRNLIMKDAAYEIQLLSSSLIQIDVDDGICRLTVTLGTALVPGNWYHMVYTYRDGAQAFYLDGVRQGTETQSCGTVDVNTNDVFIGSASAILFFHRGTMDDIRIYNRAVSPEEVTHLYQIGATTRISSTPTPSNQKSGLNSGLQAHWTFDGKDMPNGQVNDVSGNARNGSQVNTATSTFFARGQIGQALNFDGVDDRIEFGASTDLARNVSAVTTAAWIKNTGAGTGAGSMIVFMSVGSGTGNIRNALTVAEDTDTISCNGRAPDADAASSVTATYTFERNVWYHVSCGIDYANDTGQIYVNGVFQTPTATPTYTNTATNDSSPATVRVGLSGNASNAFQGLIDDVRIYHRLLTSDEHKQLYQLGR